MYFKKYLLLNTQTRKKVRPKKYPDYVLFFVASWLLTIMTSARPYLKCHTFLHEFPGGRPTCSGQAGIRSRGSRRRGPSRRSPACPRGWARRGQATSWSETASPYESRRSEIVLRGKSPNFQESNSSPNCFLTVLVRREQKLASKMDKSVCKVA